MLHMFAMLHLKYFVLLGQGARVKERGTLGNGGKGAVRNGGQGRCRLNSIPFYFDLIFYSR